MRTDIATNWDLIMMVAKDEKEDLEKLSLFSLDVLARIDVLDAPSLTDYEITIDGQIYPYTRQIADDNQTATQAIIDMINTTRELFYKVTAIKGDFDDQLWIQSKQCFADINVSVGNYLTATTGKPFAIGGRSFILEETANRVLEKKYKNASEWKLAQTYYSAHIAVQSKLPAPGLGSLSSDNEPGESMSYLIPALNPKANEEILMTTYGKRYNDFKKRRTVPVRVYG